MSSVFVSRVSGITFTVIANAFSFMYFGEFITCFIIRFFEVYNFNQSFIMLQQKEVDSMTEVFNKMGLKPKADTPEHFKQWLEDF